ncbi:MAG: 50S ribosomal protein L19 [Patescibacteria group bacterium]
METKTQKFNKLNMNAKLPQIHPGDSVKVHQKIKEVETDKKGKGEKIKERIQIFEGVVIAAKHGKGISGTITVRKVIDGVGVERIFPLHSPAISKIEVVKSSKVRRSKLYYLRTARGKKAKLKKKEFAQAIAEEKPEMPIQDVISQEPN